MPLAASPHSVQPWRGACATSGRPRPVLGAAAEKRAPEVPQGRDRPAEGEPGSPPGIGGVLGSLKDGAWVSTGGGSRPRSFVLCAFVSSALRVSPGGPATVYDLYAFGGVCVTGVCLCLHVPECLSVLEAVMG